MAGKMRIRMREKERKRKKKKVEEGRDGRRDGEERDEVMG